MIDAPSGTGKTLAGVALRELDYSRPDAFIPIASQNKLRVVHCVWPQAVSDQVVYGEIHEAQKMCGIYPSVLIGRGRSFVNTPIPSYENDRDEYEIYVWENLLQYVFGAEEQEPFNLERFLAAKQLVDCKIVLFFDEIPCDPVDVKLLNDLRDVMKFIRNVVVVLAGTNAKAANMVGLSIRCATSSLPVGDGYHWALLITRLPRFCLEFANLKELFGEICENPLIGRCPDLKVVIAAIQRSINTGGNARLIFFAIHALQHVIVTLQDEASFIEWQHTLSALVVRNKFVKNSWSGLFAGLIGQVNLLLQVSSDSELSDVLIGSHFAFRAVPGSKYVTSDGVKLEDCAGWLYFAEDLDCSLGRSLYYSRGARRDNVVSRLFSWQTTVFPSVDQDILLYLSACRSSGYLSVIHGVAHRVSPAHVLYNCLKAHQVVAPMWRSHSAGMVNFQNPNAVVNPGSCLEVALVLSVFNAASVSGTILVGIIDFLEEFVSQLGITLTDGRTVKDMMGNDIAFQGVFIPRCLVPGNTLPEGISDFVGVLTRMNNNDEFDVILKNVQGSYRCISFEAKDRDAFSTKDMVKVAYKLLWAGSQFGVLVLRGCCNYWEKNLPHDRSQKNIRFLRDLLKLLPDQVVDTVYLLSANGKWRIISHGKGIGRLFVIQIPAAVLGR